MSAMARSGFDHKVWRGEEVLAYARSRIAMRSSLRSGTGHADRFGDACRGRVPLSTAWFGAARSRTASCGLADHCLVWFGIDHSVWLGAAWSCRAGLCSVRERSSGTDRQRGAASGFPRHGTGATMRYVKLWRGRVWLGCVLLGSVTLGCEWHGRPGHCTVRERSFAEVSFSLVTRAAVERRTVRSGAGGDHSVARRRVL